MIKIEAPTLEDAYKNAAMALECSASELVVEVVQYPSSGFLGLFKKGAIIVAAKKHKETPAPQQTKASAEAEPKQEPQKSTETKTSTTPKTEIKNNKPKQNVQKNRQQQTSSAQEEPYILGDTIMPQSFVSIQDDENYDISDINFMADYDEEDEIPQPTKVAQAIAPVATFDNDICTTIEDEINNLFGLTCFDIDHITVSMYDEKTVLIELNGEDAALLIGKEGYRYKALSYIIYNWINSKYQLQLRLEIAEFLKNQEESIYKYLEGVYENIDRDSRAQTKILDGVLIQIALKELRDRYPDKYVAIRTTKDGLKFIIINDYHN